VLVTSRWLARRGATRTLYEQQTASEKQFVGADMLPVVVSI
jgi:hypothetical protein